MSDSPGRSFYESDDRADRAEEDSGWGSPVPAEYGSLRAVRPASVAQTPAAPAEAAQPSEPAPSPLQAIIRNHKREPGLVGSLLRRLQGDAAPSTNGSTAHRDGTAAEESAMQDSLAPAPQSGVPADTAPASAVPLAPGDAPATDPGIDPAELGPALAAPPMTLGARRRRRDRRPVRVRSRATIRHLDLLAVIRVAVVFWLVILVALVVASLMLWVFADAFGSLPSIEKSVRTLFSLKSFTLHPGTVAGYTCAAGIVIAVAGTLATVLFALIYNLIADVVGGVRVELESVAAD